MGLKLGVFEFSHDQNNGDSSGAYMYCGLNMKINMREKSHGTKIVYAFFCVCFRVCVVGKNPNTPNLSPMADDAIKRSII